MELTPAAAQIADEIETRLTWPLETLLGPRAEFDAIRDHAAQAARMLAAQLASGDDKLAAQTAIDLAVLLPDAIDGDWWATPLGKLIAQSVGYPGAEAVSQSQAGAILGVSRTRVQQLLRDGRLDRHPDGGVTSVSVRLHAAGSADPA